jgi:Tfp pilus assembly protein PilX
MTPSTYPPRGDRRSGQRAFPQRGAAALIVVMVLFFIISLVAAYTSRNIIFEQRTAANQYTSEVALQAADAGLEWALGLLNSGRIDDNCASSSSPSNPSFRQRYLQISSDDGRIVAPPNPATSLPRTSLPELAACWHNRASNEWVCQCPSTSGTIATTPTELLAPSFSVRFITLDEALPMPAPPSNPPPGLVAIEVKGCSSWDSACLAFEPVTLNRCRGTVCAQLALASGLKSPPIAAVTARGSVDFGGASVTVANAEAGSTGHLVVSGATVNQTGMTRLGPPPSTGIVVENDPGLADPLFTSERMFAAIFGVWPSTYVEQPGAVKVNCAGTCDSTMVRNAVDANPGRVLVLQGNVLLNGGSSIGTATDPVVLMTTGNFGFSSSTDVYGLVYSRAPTWATSGSGNIYGAMVAEGAIGGSGSFAVGFQPDILNRARWSTGSFVMVPGSWKDFP